MNIQSTSLADIVISMGFGFTLGVVICILFGVAVLACKSKLSDNQINKLKR